MPTFQLELQFNDKGAVSAVQQLGKVADAAGKAQSAIDNAAASGLTWDATVKRWRNASGAFASAAEKAAAGIKSTGAASQSAAKEIEKANAAAYKFGHTLGSSIREGGGELRSLTTKILALVGAYKALQGVSSYFGRIFDFSSNLENSQIAIASVVSATNNISDAQGRALQGAEKFNAAQEISAQLMDEIQTQALQSTATFDSLVEGVSGIIAPATKAGVSLEKLPKFAVTAAQAMTAMKIPVQQMRTEIEALLSGNISRTQDILATNLGITGKMVKNWQQQGVLVEELEKRLSTFAEAGEATAQTWTGLKSNLEDAFDYLSSKTGKGVFEGAKQSYRELLDLLVNTKGGKLGVGEDIENIVSLVKELQDEIGNNLVSVTREFIDYLRELNRPENLAELKKTINNVTAAAKTAFGVVKDVAGFIGEVGGNALDTWNALPEPVREWGLIVAILGGKKGIVGLTAALALADSLANVGQGFAALAEGKLSLSEFAFANGTELKKLLEERGYGTGISSIFQEESAAPALSRSHSTNSEVSSVVASAVGQGAKSGRGEYQISGSIGGFSDSSKGTAKIENATAKWKDFTRQIEVLNGSTAKADTGLKKTLDSITRTGKAAGKSSDEIQKMRDDYTAAFDNKSIKELNRELLQAEGNTHKLRENEISEKTDIFSARLKDIKSMSQEEKDLMLGRFTAALKTQQNTKDLQVTADFYKQLAEYSGEYGLSLEYQNKLIEAQAHNWILNGIAVSDVLRLQELMRQEAARDPWSGMLRGMRKWSAESTNLAKGFESAFTSSFDSVSDALTDFVMGAEVNLNNLTNSIVRMFVQIAAQQAVGGIVGGLASGLGKLFGGGYASSATSLVNMIPGVNFSAKGNAFSGGNLSDYSGQIVSVPTLFNYGQHLSAFARGAGLMGEAGPEAVMPLARTSSGELGVKGVIDFKAISPLTQGQAVMDATAPALTRVIASYQNTISQTMEQMRQERQAAYAMQMGHGGANAMPQVNINIQNNAGAEVNQKVSRGNNGSLNIDLMLDKAGAKNMTTPGTNSNRALLAMGGRRPVIKR